MKNILIKILVSLLIILTVKDLFAQKSPFSEIRERSLNADWKFIRDDIARAENPDFDDSKWRSLDLPHDWSIEDLPNQIPGEIVGPFSKTSVGTMATGYTVGGTAWYRKTFELNKQDQGKIVYIQFDGIYMNSDVWINGKHVGNHPHGYTSFYCDITPYLNPGGKPNKIAVQVKNEGRNSRFYSGSGIYRHVWLTVVNPVHIDVWGVSVTTPKVSETSSDVQVVTTIKNEGKENASVTLFTRLINSKGKVVGTAKSNALVSMANTNEVKQIIKVVNPKLWSIQNPDLYKAEVTVLINKKETDHVSTTFGIRDIKVDPEHGLLINGVRVKLKGGCVHHDNGPLGAVAIDRAEERKIELLKANGFNAIRSSHYPPSPYFLEICDRLGMLVIDEAFDAWNNQKKPEDYHVYFKEWWNRDLTSMILRDRNHPSVIFWSIGNEVRDFDVKVGQRTREMLVQRVHELDPTRPVNEAITFFFNWEKDSPLAFSTLDVAGYNYHPEKYESDHQSYPQRIILGTESHPRDIFENWKLVEKHPYIIGDFVWTAMDYIGENGAGHSTLDNIKKKSSGLMPWPWYNAYCGDLDLIGNKKPQSYFRDVVWRNQPVTMLVHAYIPEGFVENINDHGWPDELPSWTWPGDIGKSLQVRVFSRIPMVRLILNGKVVGEKEIKEGEITAVFDVTYEPGVLKAVNVENGKETDVFELKTTGAPSQIRLTADRAEISASRNDLSYVSVEVLDEKGQVVPNANDIEVYFTISGNGEIAGVGNGNPVDNSSFQQPRKKVWHGKGLVIVRPKGSSGKIELTANAKGLKGDSIEIKIK